MYSGCTCFYIPIPSTSHFSTKACILFRETGVLHCTIIHHFKSSVCLIATETVGFTIDFTSPELSSRTTHRSYPIILTIDTGRTIIELIESVYISFIDSCIEIFHKEVIVLSSQFSINTCTKDITTCFDQLLKQVFFECDFSTTYQWMTSCHAISKKMDIIF